APWAGAGRGRGGGPGQAWAPNDGRPRTLGEGKLRLGQGHPATGCGKPAAGCIQPLTLSGCSRPPGSCCPAGGGTSSAAGAPGPTVPPDAGRPPEASPDLGTTHAVEQSGVKAARRGCGDYV